MLSVLIFHITCSCWQRGPSKLAISFQPKEVKTNPVKPGASSSQVQQAERMELRKECDDWAELSSPEFSHRVLLSLTSPLGEKSLVNRLPRDAIAANEVDSSLIAWPQRKQERIQREDLQSPFRQSDKVVGGSKNVWHTEALCKCLQGNKQWHSPQCLGLFSQCTIFPVRDVALVFGFLLKDTQLPSAPLQQVWHVGQQSPETI